MSTLEHKEWLREDVDAWNERRRIKPFAANLEKEDFRNAGPGRQAVLPVPRKLPYRIVCCWTQ